MNATTRKMCWESVDRALTHLQIAPGSSFPVAFMARVKKEQAIPEVRAELARAQCEIVAIERRRLLFGRRWEVFAQSVPQPISRAQLDPWLDALDASLARYDATVVTWLPLLPAA